MDEHKVDWFQLIMGLQRLGFSHHQIGLEIGVTRRTVGNWQTGYTEPRYSDGSKLICLYRTVKGST